MTLDELRQTIVQGDDQLMGIRIVWNHMTVEQQNVILSVRDFFADTTDAKAADALSDILNRFNQRS